MGFIKLYKQPDRNTWPELLRRPTMQTAALETAVRNILEEVKETGDAAVDKYTLQFDKSLPPSRKVQPVEFLEAENKITDALKASIIQAKENIELFHRSQALIETPLEIKPGITCWRKSVPIEKVGLYIPGGTAPLFSTLLMLGIPAKIAGCEDIIICTPPAPDGSIHPAILFTAKLIGVDQIYKIGGVQAIAAMAYGTASLPAVYKIFGPGNQYVTEAKKIIQQEGIAIDMPAGPSELAVYADETAVPEFVAADLLSQCEHGADSQVILVTDNEKMAEQVMNSIAVQLEKLPRKEVARKSLSNSKIIIVDDIEHGMDLLNEYAPEHLILACRNPEQVAANVKNAGSVFLGNYAPESAGDYASGTNHTLPTNGYARAYSGVSLDSFVKKITFQQLTKEGLKIIGNSIVEMANAEGLQAHAAAVQVRLSN